MKKLFVLFAFIMSSNSMADTGFNFSYSVGLTFGGETLQETTANSTLKSGGLIFGSLGTVYVPQDSNWQIQGMFGLHIDSLEADNGTAEFSRFTVELMPFYMINDSVRFGIGLMQMSSVEFTQSIFGSSSLNIGFDNAVAPVVELGWRLNEYSWFSVRYISVEYDVASINGFAVSGTEPLDGSNFGLYYTAGF